MKECAAPSNACWKSSVHPKNRLNPAHPTSTDTYTALSQSFAIMSYFCITDGWDHPGQVACRFTSAASKYFPVHFVDSDHGSANTECTNGSFVCWGRHSDCPGKISVRF